VDVSGNGVHAHESIQLAFNPKDSDAKMQRYDEEQE
jgi:hypothetical protein